MISGISGYRIPMVLNVFICKGWRQSVLHRDLIILRHFKFSLEKMWAPTFSVHTIKTKTLTLKLMGFVLKARKVRAQPTWWQHIEYLVWYPDLILFVLSTPSVFVTLHVLGMWKGGGRLEGVVFSPLTIISYFHKRYEAEDWTENLAILLPQGIIHFPDTLCF